MNSAVVAFTDPQGVFKKYEARLHEHLRVLTNLHWRPPSATEDIPSVDTSNIPTGSTSSLPRSSSVDHDRTSVFEATAAAVRTVPTLELQLTPESGQRRPQHQIPGLNNAPHVQILVFETASIDIYRSKLRHIGKDWYKNQVQVRDPTGYVVVHSVHSSDASKQAKSMWTRITNEFDVDHCIQLNPDASSDWARLRNLVKDQLLWAFSARISMLDSEIRKIMAMRDVPGWNFGAMFVIHESLAWAYESMNLLDDALSVYELLERMLPDNDWLQKSVVMPLTGFIGTQDAMVEPMLGQTSPHFDAHRHVIARQVALLLAMATSRKQQEEQVDSLADNLVLSGLRLALARLPSLLTSLNELSGRATSYRWLLSVTRELYTKVTEIGSSKLVEGKGDLLLVERDALQALALLKSYTIPGVFNDIQLNEDTKAEKVTEAVADVAELTTEDAYHEEFVRLTKQAIEYFRVSNTQRAVTRLTAQLVLMAYHKSNFEESWTLLNSCPQLLRLAPQERSLVTMLGVALDCAERQERHAEILELSWQILTLVSYQTVPQKVVERAVDLVSKFGSLKALEHPISHWFDPRVDPYMRGDAQGYFLELNLIARDNYYPFSGFDSAELVATVEFEQGPSRREIVFKSSDLKDASKTIRLYTQHFIQGTLRLERVELRFKKQTLTHEFTDIRVAMRPLATAVHAQLTLAKCYSMRKRSLHLKIIAPVSIGHAKVHFQPIDPHLQLLLDKIEGSESLQNFSTAQLTVPALVDHDNPVSQLRVTIEYDDCMYEFRETVDFGLSISVDFQEYFRSPPNVLSQFLVKPVTSTPFIFCGAELTGSRIYDVADFAHGHRQREYVAFENAPVSYVFSLVKRSEPLRKASPEMHLSLTYRSLLWECQHLLYDACVSALKLKGLQCYTPSVGMVAQHLTKHINIEQYMITGNADVPVDVIPPYVEHEFENMDPRDAQRVLTVISEALENGIRGDNSDFASLNATMELEVPNPDVELVHYVNIDIERDSQPCIVGGSIPVMLEIETMAVQDNDASTRLFAYELDRLSEGWSYTGKSKGVFSGTDVVREKLHLVPNRSGELLLPNIVIRPAAESHYGEEESEDSVEVLDSGTEDRIIVAKHANTRVLVVPETNLLAITF